jgi:uncharacterized protein involved in cysteine biosynthesis
MKRLINFIKGFATGVALTVLLCAAIGVGFIVIYLILSCVGGIIENLFGIDLAEYVGLQIFGLVAVIMGFLVGLGEAFNFDPFGSR